MGEQTSAQGRGRRKLLALGGLGALLGLVRGPQRAEAANGDPIRAAEVTASTGMTGLSVTAIGVPGLVVNNGGISGKGVEGVGGPSGAHPLLPAGVGLLGFGGRGRGNRAGGAGVFAEGGAAATGEGGDGLLAIGGTSGPGGRPGNGVVAIGAHRADQRQDVGGHGVVAVGGSGSGVLGATNANNAAGVYGVAGGASPGVLGQGRIGVRGQALVQDPGIGVYGNTGLNFEFILPGGGAGVVGSSTTGLGVFGLGTDQPGVAGASAGVADGVVGQSNVGRAVAGHSAAGNGGYFETDNAAAWAAHVENLAAGGGEAGNGSLGLYVHGNFVVQDGTKSAAVLTGKGITLLYCVEATTSVFEDFGKVHVSGVPTKVALDHTFKEAADTSDYAVFLSPEGPNKGLYITGKTSESFEIRELGGGGSNLDVRYRVVAQRRGLAPTHRLATLTPPEAPRPPDVRWVRQTDAGPLPIPQVPLKPTPPKPTRLQVRRSSSPAAPDPEPPRGQ